jgi:hypothetical protein
MAEQQDIQAQMDVIFKKYNDFVIYDLTNIDRKLLELPLIVSHYQNVFYGCQSQLDELELKKAEMWQAKFLYYKHQFDFALSMSDIKQFIERDNEVLVITRKMNVVRLIANRAEDTIKSLRDFSWTLKNLMEFEKFKAGIVN